MDPPAEPGQPPDCAPPPWKNPAHAPGVQYTYSNGTFILSSFLLKEKENREREQMEEFMQNCLSGEEEDSDEDIQVKLQHKHNTAVVPLEPEEGLILLLSLCNPKKF